MTSLIFQAGRFDVGAPDPPFEAQTRALEYIEKVYPRTPLIDFTDDGLLKAIRRIINSGFLNDDASPGIPYSELGADNQGVLTYSRDFIEKVCFDRLKLWRDTPSFEVEKLTEVELIKYGFADPVRMHVKQEPHTSEKVKTGRMRLISGMSLVNQICERVLHDAQNQAEIATWWTIPSMIGIGFTDRQNNMVYKAFMELLEEFRMTGSDISGWDWSVRFWMFCMLCEARITLTNARGTPAENLYRVWIIVIRRKIFSTTNGRFFVTIVQDIIMTSGSFVTGAGNSVMREGLSATLAYEANPDYVGPVPARAVGDDCLEPEFENPRNYLKYGFRITDTTEVTPEMVEFCSHSFKPGGKASLLSWARSVFRTLGNQPDDERWLQLMHELRHNPERKQIAQFLVDCNWIPPVDFGVDVVNQCIPCPITHELGGGKISPIKQNMEEVIVKDMNKKARAQNRAAKQHGPQAFKSKSNEPQKAAGKKTRRKKKKAAGGQVAIVKMTTALDPRLDPAHGIVTLQMHKDLHNQLMSISDPWKYQGYKSVINRAPAPTRLSTVATTRWNSTSMEVPATKTVQIVLFPGHGPTDMGLNVDVTMPVVDTQAFHARPFYYSTGGTALAPVYAAAQAGPYTYVALYSDGAATIPPAMGLYTDSTSALPMGYATTISDGYLDASHNSTWQLIQPDVPLPLIGASGIGHSRWQCVSAGITIKNITVVAQRGGSIVTVQPDQPYFQTGTVNGNFTNTVLQTSFDRFRSYTNHGSSCKVTMNLRPEDQAFWHTFADTNSTFAVNQTDSMANAGIYVWLNGDPGNQQNYEISVVYNWELAGYYIEPVAEASIHQPGAHGIMERVSQNLQTHPGASAAKTEGFAAMAANAAEQGFKVAKGIAVAGAGFVHDVGKAAWKGPGDAFAGART